MQNLSQPRSNKKQEKPSAQSQVFSECLAKWLLVFSQVYRQEMSEVTVWAYREALSDLTVSELDRGCADAMKRIKFVPTPAEIRECMERTRPAPQFAPQLVEAPMTREQQEDAWLELKVKASEFEKNNFEGVISLTDEELRRRKEELKAKAIDWWESHGSQGESA